MKKLIFPLSLAVVLFTASCGGGTTDNAQSEENHSEQAVANGMMEYDLSQHGLNLSIMIPDETIGVAEVMENEYGGVDIMVGPKFAISIVFGEGDVALKKADLSEDLVYTTTFHTDEADLLVYEKEIPDSGIEAEHHFFYTVTVGEDIFDVENLKGASFGEKAIQTMVASARSLRAKEGA